MQPKDLEPEEIQLSNGISVVLQHYEGSVAATYWWVRTGSADEKPAEAGYAHFLEHMLFKDAAAKETGRASTGQTARAIESLGGDINAYTSFDQTVYHVTCAAQHWERVIDSFGAMAKPQRFLKSDFEREREVILEELRKNEDSPGRQLFQKLFSLSFRKHPYGRPVIGFVRTLKAARAATVEAFYRRQYVAGRMGLVLVGPLHDAKGARRKAIIARLEKHFGAKVLKAGHKAPSAPHPRATEPELRSGGGVRGDAVRRQDAELVHRLPRAGAPARGHARAGSAGRHSRHGRALAALSEAFLREVARHRRLGRALRPAAIRACSTSRRTWTSMDKLNTVAEELFRELKRLERQRGRRSEELERVIVNVESEKLYATQTADGMAGRLGFLRFVVDDLDFDRRYLEQLRAVDPARIREVARRYFDYRRMSGRRDGAEGARSFDIGEIRDLAHRLLKPARGGRQKPALVHKAALGASSPSPVELLQLPSGIRVVHFERPQSHVVSVHACALGGLRLELGHPLGGDRRHDWGTSYLMALTWTKGTSKLDSRAIARECGGPRGEHRGLLGPQQRRACR